MASPDADLIETLRGAQRLGALGDRSLDDVVEHARAFTRALRDIHGTVVDLGSGGGVPGLVVAVDRPDLRLVLVDRRQKRTDHLLRAVHRLELGDRVDVRTGDVARLAVDEAHTFDAAIARGFGPPSWTLRLGVGLVRRGGAVVISEPPAGDRWDPDLLDELAVTRRRIGPVSRFDVV